MLDDVAPLVAGRTAEHVVATVDLTDECGPRCVRLR